MKQRGEFNTEYQTKYFGLFNDRCVFQDLFSSVTKSHSIQVKPAVSQPKKALSSALFSDDEVYEENQNWNRIMCRI